MILPLLYFILPILYVWDNFKIYVLGFCVLYVGFGLLLLELIFNKETKVLPKFVSNSVFIGFVTKIGKYSYSIYIIHMAVELYIVRKLPTTFSIYLSFAIYFLLSIFIGIIALKTIEFSFLNVRDKYFPKKL